MCRMIKANLQEVSTNFETDLERVGTIFKYNQLGVGISLEDNLGGAGKF